MNEAGYTFRVQAPSPGAECGMCSRETPPELVGRLAWQKAADVAPQIDEGIVIACDTVAECMGQILGKPANREHAREMLQLMSGRPHQVFSGLCLWRRPDDVTRATVEVTKLRMDPLSDELIESYLDANQWDGKAGAFGYQDGWDWIHLESGTESNVVGLPMDRLSELLTELTE